jgi:hypothetical protein
MHGNSVLVATGVAVPPLATQPVQKQPLSTPQHITTRNHDFARAHQHTCQHRAQLHSHITNPARAPATTRAHATQHGVCASRQPSSSRRRERHCSAHSGDTQHLDDSAATRPRSTRARTHATLAETMNTNETHKQREGRDGSQPHTGRLCTRGYSALRSSSQARTTPRHTRWRTQCHAHGFTDMAAQQRATVRDARPQPGSAAERSQRQSLSARRRDGALHRHITGHRYDNTMQS